MAKKAQKQQRSPNLPPGTLLRARLDGLFNHTEWVDQSTEKLGADLDAVTRGVKANDYLLVLLKATAVATATVQQRMLEIVPDWLQKNEGLAQLKLLVERNTVAGSEEALAIAWLQASGLPITKIVTTADKYFFAAYYGADDLGSQAILIFLFYTNSQRSRVSGFQFLIDFNPPWEGALKDGFQLPQRGPAEAIRQFITPWEEKNELQMDPVDANWTRNRLIEAMLCNRSQKIRLRRDIAAIRDPMTTHLLNLPASPETPAFSLADFDELLHLDTGKTTEELVHFEETVGRRVRTEDGKELVYMGNFGKDRF